MKVHIITAIFTALAMVASAQDKLFLVPTVAVIKDEEGNPSAQVIWLIAATDKAIRYLENKTDTDYTDAARKNVISLYFQETQSYATAVDLYQARKYEEAKELFAVIKQKHQPVKALPNNPGAMAAYYEMECLRKLGDLKGLSNALKAFDKRSLTRELQQRQLELYVLWDAVRSESWDALEELARERENTKLPGGHRTQVAYCHGLALEGLNRPQKALLAYQTAITADAGASEVIARESALRVLEILHADPAVKGAMKAFDSSGGKKMTNGYTQLLEAAGVAGLFEMSLGAGAPLPDKFKFLLKYKQEPKPAAKEEVKEEAKVEEPAKAKPAAKGEAKKK